jgi:hypothetical protein
MPISKGHCTIDVGRLGYTLLNHPYRLDTDKDTKSARRETGSIIDERLFHAKERHHRSDPVQRDTGRVRPPDHLDKMHRPHRIEEMHAGESIRVREASRKVIDRDA